MAKEQKAVVVGKKHSAGEDEIYAEWFRCPACQKDEKGYSGHLLRYFQFCPVCGVPIKFTKAALREF